MASGATSPQRVSPAIASAPSHLRSYSGSQDTMGTKEASLPDRLVSPAAVFVFSLIVPARVCRESLGFARRLAVLSRLLLRDPFLGDGVGLVERPCDLFRPQEYASA